MKNKATLVIFIFSIVIMMNVRNSAIRYQGIILLRFPVNIQLDNNRNDTGILNEDISKQSVIDEQKKEIKRIKERIGTLEEIESYSLLRKEICQLENQSIVLFKVDEKNTVFENFKKICGRYFVKQDIVNNEKYVVIDKKFAIKKFATVDCIGKMLEIWGEQYTVIGVIERKDKLDSFIHNRPEIYLPIEDGEEQYILLKCKNMKEQWVAKCLENKNIEIQDLTLDVYDIFNRINISISIVIILLIFKTIKTIRKYSEKYINEWRELYKKEYFSTVLKREILKSWRIIVYILILVMLIVTLCNMRFRINSEYIPYTLAYGNIVKEAIYNISNEEMQRMYFAIEYRQIMMNLKYILNINIILFFLCFVKIFNIARSE